LPFGDEAFDLVVSRHPVTTWWAEIARVLQPGGTYFSQQVGPRSVGELVEWFVGPQPKVVIGDRNPDRLLVLHERIQRDGPFLAHTTRFLLEARKQG
jgi:SAM-dependent methyltransferase